MLDNFVSTQYIGMKSNPPPEFAVLPSVSFCFSSIKNGFSFILVCFKGTVVVLFLSQTFPVCWCYR